MVEGTVYLSFIYSVFANLYYGLDKSPWTLSLATILGTQSRTDPRDPADVKWDELMFSPTNGANSLSLYMLYV